MTPAEITAARKSLGMTQAQLAKALHCSRTQINGYENGRVPMPAVRAALLRAYLGGWREGEPSPRDDDTDALKAMMRDPRYWRDRDPAFIRQVAKGKSQ